MVQALEGTTGALQGLDADLRQPSALSGILSRPPRAPAGPDVPLEPLAASATTTPSPSAQTATPYSVQGLRSGALGGASVRTDLRDLPTPPGLIPQTAQPKAAPVPLTADASVGLAGNTGPTALKRSKETFDVQGAGYALKDDKLTAAVQGLTEATTRQTRAMEQEQVSRARTTGTTALGTGRPAGIPAPPPPPSARPPAPLPPAPTGASAGKPGPTGSAENPLQVEHATSGRALITSIVGRRASLALAQTGIGKALEPAAGRMLVASEALNKVGQGMSALASTMNVLNDSTKTNAEKMETLAQQIPLIGQFVQGGLALRDALNGTDDFIRRGRRDVAVFQAGKAAETRYQGQIASAQMDAAGHRFRAEALHGVQIEQGPTARETYRESIAYQEFQRRVPLLDEGQRLRANETAAERSHTLAKGNLATAQAERQRLVQRRTAAQNELNRVINAENRGTSTAAGAVAGNALSFVSPAAGILGRLTGAIDNEGTLNLTDSKAKANAAFHLQRIDAEMGQNAAAMEHAVNQERQTGTQLIEAQNAARRNGLDLARADLEIARQREQRLRTQASRFGGMNVVEQRLTYHAIEMAQKHGFASLPRYYQEKIAAFNPDAANREFAKIAEANPLYKKIQQSDYAINGTINETAKAVDQGELNIRKQVNFNEAKLSEGLSQVMDNFADKLAQMMGQAVNRAEQQVRLAFQQFTAGQR
jgi:hypothetical protein